MRDEASILYFSYGVYAAQRAILRQTPLQEGGLQISPDIQELTSFASRNLGGGLRHNLEKAPQYYYWPI